MKKEAFKLQPKRILLSAVLVTAITAAFPLPSEANNLALNGLEQSGG